MSVSQNNKGTGKSEFRGQFNDGEQIAAYQSAKDAVNAKRSASSLAQSRETT